MEAFLIENLCLQMNVMYGVNRAVVYFFIRFVSIVVVYCKFIL